ncbi:MAG TPA: hypothetical protein PLE92_07010 [Lentisphaeria bacterium]|nr:hypothetical protein [Lentisphaeria bacterium]
MRTLILVLLCVTAGCERGAGPAARPPASPESIAPKVVVREVLDRSKDASVQVSFAGDAMHIHAISPRGIGGARIELTSGAWPQRVVVHLSYAPDRPFAGLEGAGAAFEPSASQQGGPQTQLPVQKLATSGFEITPIPVTDSRVLHVHWIDFYR